MENRLVDLYEKDDFASFEEYAVCTSHPAWSAQKQMFDSVCVFVF